MTRVTFAGESPTLFQSEDHGTELDSFLDLLLIADGIAFQVGSRESAVAGARIHFKQTSFF